MKRYRLHILLHPGAISSSISLGSTLGILPSIHDAQLFASPTLRLICPQPSQPSPRIIIVSDYSRIEALAYVLYGPEACQYDYGAVLPIQSVIFILVEKQIIRREIEVIGLNRGRCGIDVMRRRKRR